MAKARVTKKVDYNGTPYLLLESKGVQGSAIIERSTVWYLVSVLKEISDEFSFIQLSQEMHK